MLSNFKSLFVLTYGRSGSTLLQGILNSIDGFEIRGENCDFLYPLFMGYKRLQQSKVIGKQFEKEDDSTHPWYGYTQISLEEYKKSCFDLSLKSLFNIQDSNILGTEIKCIGFKEIRYLFVKDLKDYLDFIKSVFPNTLFIINTRNKEDVIKSGWWKEKDKEEALNILHDIESEFFNFQKDNPNITFHIKYESIVNKDLKDLFNFIKIPLDTSKIDLILNKEHSSGNIRKFTKK